MNVVLLANSSWYLYRYRLDLARRIEDTFGATVILVAPRDEYSSRLEKAGYRFEPITLSRRGINPLKEFRTIRQIADLCGAIRPALVHHFTLKGVIYGSLAARKARVPHVINAVTGLGFAFSSDGLRARLLRAVIVRMLRRTVRDHTLIVQSENDRKQLVRLGVTSEERIALIKGSGVTSAPSDSGTRSTRPLVLYAGRLLKPKGVAEFVEAAGLVRQRRPDARFQVAGAPDPGNPESISPEMLERWAREQDVELLGHRDDIEDLMAASWIVVLPTRYGEGIPRVLLEAAVRGCALVASDAPMCRELVTPDVSGVLVDPSDPEAIADAVLALVNDEDRRARLASHAREIVLEEFSEQAVNGATLDLYGDVLGQSSIAGRTSSTQRRRSVAGYERRSF